MYCIRITSKPRHSLSRHTRRPWKFRRAAFFFCFIYIYIDCLFISFLRSVFLAAAPDGSLWRKIVRLLVTLSSCRCRQQRTLLSLHPVPLPRATPMVSLVNLNCDLIFFGGSPNWGSLIIFEPYYLLEIYFFFLWMFFSLDFCENEHFSSKKQKGSRFQFVWRMKIKFFWSNQLFQEFQEISS
jgi:hypothetical protein